MSRKQILILFLSLIEVVVLLATLKDYVSLRFDTSPSSDQFQGFGLFFEIFFIPTILFLSLIITILFGLLCRDREKAGLVSRKLTNIFAIMFGITPLVVVTGCFAIATGYDLVYSHNVKRITVTDVHDTLLLSSKGEPMGVRLSYNAQFPSANNYFIRYSLDSAPPGLDSYSSLSSLQEYGHPKISPSPEEGGDFYRAGKTYSIVVDFIPSLYSYTEVSKDGSKQWTSSYQEYPSNNPTVDDNTERCLNLPPFTREEFDQFNKDNDIEEPLYLKMYIAGETTLIEKRTEGSYSIGKFHQGAIQDGVLPCSDTGT